MNYPDEMFEEAERREAVNRALNALDKLYQDNCAAMEMLSEIERKEQMDPVQVAVCAIGKYSDALEELTKTEKKDLRAELEEKKKENFQALADACMQDYHKRYDRDTFPVDESWVYMVGEYFGTGEGQTTCIMMTQAVLSEKEDFGDEPHTYIAKTTKEYRAVRAFHKEFGTWMLHGLKFLSRQDFLTEYAYHIPPVMMKLINASCYKEFHTRIHYNFS